MENENFFTIGGNDIPMENVFNVLGSFMNYQRPEVPTIDSITPQTQSNGAPSYAGISTFMNDAYNMPSEVDMGAENTANTLNMAKNGAKIGAAFGGIGAPVGAAVGALTGFVTGKARKRRAEKRAKAARAEAIEEANELQDTFNQSNLSHNISENVDDRTNAIRARNRFPTLYNYSV